MKKILSYLLLVCTYSFAFSSVNKDSIQVNKYVFNNNFSSLEVFSLQDSIVDYHYYTKYRNDYSINKGYLGSYSFNLMPNQKANPGFYIDDFYLFSENENNIIYTNKAPVTSVFFMNTPNSGKEQYFDIFHSQKLFNLIGFNFKLNKTTSTGDYYFQNTKTTSFSNNIFYSGKRYSSIIDYDFNNISDTENGGVSYRSDMIDFKPSMDVWLTDVNSFNRNHKIILHQKINLVNAKEDTLKKSKALYLVTNTSYENRKRKHLDNDSLPKFINDGYYQFYSPFFNRNSLPIFDSIVYSSLINTVGFSNVNLLTNLEKEKPKDFIYSTLVSYQWFKTTQNDTINNGNNIYFDGLVTYQIKNNLKSNLSLKYNFYGFNKGDFIFNFNSNYFFNDSLDTKLSLNTTYSSLKPGYIYKRYVSSQDSMSWNRPVKNTDIFFASLRYINLLYRFELSASYFNILGHMFFNEKMKPEQYHDKISLIEFFISKKTTFLKKLNLNIEGKYHYSSFNEIYPVPKLSSKGSLFFQSYIFRKAMLFNIGIDGYYFSSYTAKAYSPILGNLYLQQNQLIGSYPYLDFFVNAQIKNAKVFLKVSHLNSDLMGYNYYLIPEHPVRGRMIQLGLKWNFYY